MEDNVREIFGIKNSHDSLVTLEDLNLVDKFLFDEVMEDKEVYQMFVSIILENEIELLERPETEKELRISPLLRQVRLDVISMDKENNLYYTEMQKKNTGNLIRRSRYYQAQLDVSLLEPGSTDFNLLNDSCFILIAPFDLFGKGLFRYTFEGTCRECPELKLGDGAIRVFINLKGKNREDFSQEFLEFMQYIMKTTNQVAENSISRRIKKIHEKIKKIRSSEKIGVKFMQRWEELVYARQDGVAEGLELGKEQGMEQGIRHGIEILLSTCSDLGISRETAYAKLKEKLQLTDAKTEEYMKLFWKNDSIIKS